MADNSILIIDDDSDMCLLLSKFLRRNNFRVSTASSAAKGIAEFRDGRFDVVLCDYRLGDKDGKDVLQEIKSISPRVIFIIITAYSDIKIAVDVIKRGAYDYITKPLIPDEVLNVLNRAFADSNDLFGVNDVKTSNKEKTHPTVSVAFKQDYLLEEAKGIQDVYKQIMIVAPTDYSIILYGESGTGKEVIAKTIHQLSKRSGKPFVAMDCGTLSKELAGSELFGHVKGAYTGALSDKEGHFELADGGTLFLDEVANLSIEVQASLLRVIQERKFKRVGGNKERSVDVRIIVASNENLREAYHKGKFREDLFHRFNEFSIYLPPLRDRKEDIPLFADFFLQKAKVELARDIDGFEDDVMQMFLEYSWPGNLREFRNVVRRAVLLTEKGKVHVNTLPVEIIDSKAGYGNSTNFESNKIEELVSTETQGARSFDLKNAATRAEYDEIMRVLKDVNFNKTKAAEILHIDRKTLYNKIKSYEDSMSKS